MLPSPASAGVCIAAEKSVHEDTRAAGAGQQVRENGWDGDRARHNRSPGNGFQSAPLAILGVSDYDP